MKYWSYTVDENKHNLEKKKKKQGFKHVVNTSFFLFYIIIRPY